MLLKGICKVTKPYFIPIIMRCFAVFNRVFNYGTVERSDFHIHHRHIDRGELSGSFLTVFNTNRLFYY